MAKFKIINKNIKTLFRHIFYDTLYVYISLLWKTFSLGPDEARSILSKASLSTK